MGNLDKPLVLEARDVFGRMDRGCRTKPLRAAAFDGDEQEYTVILKPVKPDCHYGDGHYGGTSLACELICAMLARAIGVMVPDYAIVNIPEKLSKSARNPEIRALLESNVGPNFGSVYLEGHQTWQGDFWARDEHLLDALEDVLGFDCTVINGDRKVGRPNLLWAGDDKVFAIDHSLALPMHLWGVEAVSSSPLMPEANVREHCTFENLKKKNRPYKTFGTAWAKHVSGKALNDIRAAIPKSWEHEPTHLDTIFAFLHARVGRVDAIGEDLRRIVE